MPWRPSEPGAVPTLGYEVVDWISENLAAPDRADYEPFLLYPEQEDFVLRLYEIEPKTGKRKYRRGVLSRPRGWGKSPLLAALAIVEGLGPVVPAGWDADGQPVGMPWVDVRTPLVQIAAVSEKQTQNTWGPLLEMLEGPVIDNYPGLEPLGTFVNLPRGRIEPITSSARSVKGNKPVFAVLDQTEEWVPSNGGVWLARTMRINAAKIGGHTVESPNAFTPGEHSVAEDAAAYWSEIRRGRTKDDGLYYDHREAPANTDMGDRESLRVGLAYAYGDSADVNGGHVDLERLIGDIWDPANDEQVSRADFLNQITHATDSWITQPDWWGCKADPPVEIGPSELVTLGFDGSIRRARGITDASALMGCRVSDGHIFEIHVWEQPTGPSGKDWKVPFLEVNAEIDAAFGRYNVVGFYADPARWESYVAAWEAKYGHRLQVKSSRTNPIEWWMTGGRAVHTVRALESFETAVTERKLTHDGAMALSRHVLNARRRASSRGWQIHKSFPDSPDKIDGAVAAVLAWQARLDAVAAGVSAPKVRYAPKKLR